VEAFNSSLLRKMKKFSSVIQRLSTTNFWLLTFTVTILGLNLNLVGKAGLTNLQVTTILYTGAIAFRFKNNSHSFNLESGLAARILSICIIALMFENIPILPNYDLLIRCLPFISAFSLALFSFWNQRVKAILARTDVVSGSRCSFRKVGGTH